MVWCCCLSDMENMLLKDDPLYDACTAQNNQLGSIDPGPFKNPRPGLVVLFLGVIYRKAISIRILANFAILFWLGI